MAKLVGTAGSVKVATAAKAGIRSWSVDYVVDAVESTDFSVVGVAAYLPGVSRWSGRFEGFKDAAPIAIGSEVALELLESATAGQKWTGQAIITAVHATTEHSALVGYSYDFQGTAALTIPTA